jgi:CBS domain-containing protein
MVNLLIIILDDLSRLPDLLHAFRNIGVPGVTIFESVGAHRVQSWLDRVGLGGLDRLFESREIRRRTLLAAVEDEELLAKAIAEAEQVVGGFDQPNTGLLLVLPVTQVKGLHKVLPKPTEEKVVPAVSPNWVALRDTPVEVAAAILDLEPTIVKPDTPLTETARLMVAHPNVHVVCVVAEDGRLMGILGLRALADDIFFHIIPEEFLSEIHDLDEAIEYAKRSRIRTAADAMRDPIWVKEGETVKDAFKRMHEHHLSGMPVVDDQYHVVGYINLLELIALCCEGEVKNIQGDVE